MNIVTLPSEVKKNHDNIVTIKFRNFDQRKFLIEYRYFGQN